MTENSFADFIKQRRKALNLSQDELGKRCGGLSQSYVQQLEQGTNPRTGRPISPTVSTIVALARGLQVSPQELWNIALGREKDQPLEPDDARALAIIDRVRRLPPAERDRYLVALETLLGAIPEPPAGA